MAQTGMKWYVLRAVSGKEAKVKEYLEALIKHDDTLAANVGQILLPTEKYAQLRNGKRVVKEKLFLPGYVLVEANLQSEIAHVSLPMCWDSLADSTIPHLYVRLTSTAF